MKIYLVGDKNAPKNNSWEYMCKSKEEADRLQKAPFTEQKEVQVQAPRRRK